MRPKDDLNPQVIPIKLTCVFDSPNQLMGTEILIEIDLKNNHIFVNGNDAKDPLINDNQFIYKWKLGTVSISRSTGKLIITYPDGVLGRGSCDQTKQRKF